jgi:ATP-dependent protease ClpP protease subunit
MSTQADMDSIQVLLDEAEAPNLQLPDPTLLQYYSDLSNRTLWISDEIDPSLLGIISHIIRWNKQDEQVPINGRKPIKLLFNSEGGFLNVAETLISVIRMSKTPIYGIALGLVASAASLIYLACPYRYALPNAYFIFHRGSCANMGGNFNEIQAAMEDYRSQVEKMERFYIENTNYPEEMVREKIKTDWYIHYDEAKKFGVVNKELSESGLGIFYY